MTTLRIRTLADTEAHPSEKDAAGSPPGAATFVAEAKDEAGGWQIVASLRLLHAIGTQAPRYWYYVGQVAYSADALKLNRRDNVLLLGSDFTGANEIRDVRCELAAVTAEARTTLLTLLIQGALKLASTASSAEATKTIIALPGVREHDRSPFWEGFGRHFYDRDPARAIAEFGERWHTDVAALLPQQPVIVSLLNSAAQRAIGSVGDSAVELSSALIASGFRARQHVSIHDGGPVYEHDPAPGEREVWAGMEVEPVDHLERSRTWAVLQGRALWVVQAERAAGRLQMERSTIELLDAQSSTVVASLLSA